MSVTRLCLLQLARRTSVRRTLLHSSLDGTFPKSTFLSIWFVQFYLPFGLVLVLIQAPKPYKQTPISHPNPATQIGHQPGPQTKAQPCPGNMPKETKMDPT